MPKTMTTTKTASIGSDSFVQRYTDTGNSQDGAFPTVPAAKTGTLTTRTDDDTGTCTMASGHGFSTSDKIDLFWAGGSRRAMDATVTGDSVVLDGGSGDNLPIATTAITAMKPVEVLLDLTGDDVVALAVNAPQGGYVVFVDDAPADISAATYRLSTTSPGSSWTDSSGETNPLAGATVTAVKFSHGYSAGAVDMTATAIYN